MARNGSGVYALPDGYEAVTGETILATQHNTPLEDLAADANTARPIVAGGTGATTAAGARTALGVDRAMAKSTDIASATTTDLATATGNVVDITGTTTITGLGTVAAGQVYVLQFDGALTLTHNATSLILPGAANITTAAGDIAVMVSEGSGNWRCVKYLVAVIPPRGSLTTNTAVGGAATYSVTIPSWANVVHIGMDNISVSSSGIPRIRLSDAGGEEATGYSGGGTTIGGSNYTSSTGLEITAAATAAFGGRVTLIRRNTSSWMLSSQMTFVVNGSTVIASVSKSTSETTTGFTLTNSAGANFGAGGQMVTTFYP